MISALLVVLLAQAGSGIEAFQRGDYRAARPLLEQAAASDARAKVFLALVRAATGECEVVLPDLGRHFSLPEPALRRLAGLALAQCHIASKRFGQAAPIVAKLEQDFPTDADVLYVAANFHMKAWNDTIYRMYQTAPASWRTDQLSAEVFESQGRIPEAVAEFRKAIGKNPRGINLHYRLGRAILQQSHDPAGIEEARKEFDAELALNPSDAVAEYQVAQIFATQGKKAEAAVRYERAAQLRPDFPEALIAVAKLRSEAKRYAEAVELLEKAVRLQPRSEPARYALMLAYRNAGRTDDARKAKAELDKLQKPPEGEFSDFLKRLGEKPPQ